MKMFDTKTLREKYMKYWGEENCETDDDAFDEFGEIIDVDLANEIVEWSVQAANKIDTLEEECELLGKYANFLKLSLRSGEFHAADVEFADFRKKYKETQRKNEMEKSK